MSYDSGIQRSKIMEVPYLKEEEEEEEVVGVDLQTRRKSKSHHENKRDSYFSSSESNLTSESSDSSFEYTYVSMDIAPTSNSNNNINKNGVTITNGENPKIIESRSDSERAVQALSQADDEAEFEETEIRDHNINVSHNQDSNGFTVHQNEVHVVESSVPENDAGDKEKDIGSITPKSTETDVGLKNEESLLDEGSNNINFMLSETYNVENIVNNTFIVKDQNEIVETGPSQEIEPDLEFDVEKVIEKQKTHDLFCPNCNSCITKRVILKRRKRKFEVISTNEGLKPDPTVPSDKDTEEKRSENERNKDTEDPGARFGAVSCFSCFSIFIPKGDGFLWWRFKPKADVLPHSDGTSLEYKDPEMSPTDDGRGKRFPLWILTCCQPNHIEKPVTDSLFNNNEVPVSPSHGNQLQDLQPTPKSPGTANNHDFPLWFLSCCQPSTDRVKPERSPKPGPEVLTHEREPPSTLPGDTPVLPVRPSTVLDTGLGIPPHGSKPLPKSEDNAIPNTVPLTTPDHGPEVLAHEREPPSTPSVDTSVHPTQPSTTLDTDSKLPPESQPPVTPDEVLKVPSDGSKPPLQPEDNEVDNALPLSTPGHGTFVPHAQKPPVASEGGFPLWFLTCCQPSMDGNNPKPPEKPEDAVLPSDLKPQPTPEDESHKRDPPTSEPWLPLPKPLTITEPEPEPETSTTTTTTTFTSTTTTTEGHVVVSISKEQPTQSNLPRTGSASAIDQHVQLPPRHLSPGVSGVDIIKAMVYGGLVECVTSLSVISSAAGGDATTLNIVALGLANVFGGLVVLLHDLRVLKHEHTEDRYVNQLGRPDQYLLHAVVAILSYLTFGLLSPVIYGFSFRKSDNKNYKLAILAAVSLVCITVLSIGKAYVRRPPKAYRKTISYYITMGFMVSGIGYVAGDLINVLLKKLGIFDSTAPVAMPGLKAGVVQGAWSSY